jgi:uncharacterized membrane protein YfcA
MSIEISLMGLFIGFLVGLTGVGGAALLTPILLLIGISPTVAVGTDLFYNSITKLFGTFQHWRQQTINFKIVKYLTIGSVPSATAAVLLMRIFESYYQNQDDIIKHALSIVLIFVAITTLYRTFFDHKIKVNRWQLKTTSEKKWVTIIIGAVLGFIVGMTSIGSGSLFALAMLYLFRLKASDLVGTDIFHAFILVTITSLLYASFGSINYLLAGNLLTGSIPGVIFGSAISAKVPTKPLRAFIAIIILISGVNMI